jgi:hypothetical protein
VVQVAFAGTAHPVLVRSKPWSMALVIAVVVSDERNSSTTKNPAISAFK